MVAEALSLIKVDLNKKIACINLKQYEKFSQYY